MDKIYNHNDFFNVTLARGNFKKKKGSFYIAIMTIKCPFFDKVFFCKNTNKCTQKHQPQDCLRKCDNLNTSPKRQ